MPLKVLKDGILSHKIIVKEVEKQLVKEYKTKYDYAVEFQNLEYEFVGKVKYEDGSLQGDFSLAPYGVNADLVCTNPEVIIVKVYDNIKLLKKPLRSGSKLTRSTLNKILVTMYGLQQKDAKEKILVITDFRVYQELIRVIKKNKLLPQPGTNGFQIRLIELPVFKKQQGLEWLDNKSFTAGELITALKFGLVNYDTLNNEYKEAISVIMNQRGYIQKQDDMK